MYAISSPLIRPQLVINKTDSTDFICIIRDTKTVNTVYTYLLIAIIILRPHSWKSVVQFIYSELASRA